MILNWLHLRRPGTAPLDIVFGQSLNRLQWRVVRQIEGLMEACKVTSSIAASDMGRTAGKIEQVEDVLNRLSVFETAALENLHEKYERPPYSVSPQASGSAQQVRYWVLFRTVSSLWQNRFEATDWNFKVNLLLILQASLILGAERCLNILFNVPYPLKRTWNPYPM